jgi:hypothetical protein|tara:strand:- start:172 stop:288 length:117 start_codon:yes stop_codon:yes gene_type:complete
MLLHLLKPSKAYCFSLGHNRLENSAVLFLGSLSVAKLA